jgi:RES domain-containing protein
VRVWRICLRRYRIFDGEGARRYGGRWNQADTSIVYTSGSLSLAALELFVHVDIDIAPTRLVAIAADIPEELETETVDIGKLPKNWRTYPAPEALKNLGTAWAARRTTAILAVPSAVIPEEHNYLLNPRHADFNRIRIRKPIPFRFDARMWK